MVVLQHGLADLPGFFSAPSLLLSQLLIDLLLCLQLGLPLLAALLSLLLAQLLDFKVALLFIDLNPVLVLIIQPFLLRSKRTIMRDADALVLRFVNVPLNVVAFPYLPEPSVLILLYFLLLFANVARLRDLLQLTRALLDDD